MDAVRVRSRLSISVATAGVVGLLTGVAACTGQDAPDDRADTPPSTAATPATTATPAGTPTTSSTRSDGCPVDADTLFAALRAKRELADALHPGITGVRDVACHRGYATATTVVPPAEADPAFVLYRYRAADDSWTAITAGTDAICTDVVPRAIIPRLPGCVGS